MVYTVVLCMYIAFLDRALDWMHVLHQNLLSRPQIVQSTDQKRFWWDLGAQLPKKLYNFDKDYVIKSIDFLLVFVEKSTKKSQIFLSKGGRFIKTILKNENPLIRGGGLLSPPLSLRLHLFSLLESALMHRPSAWCGNDLLF